MPSHIIGIGHMALHNLVFALCCVGNAFIAITVTIESYPQLPFGFNSFFFKRGIQYKEETFMQKKLKPLCGKHLKNINLKDGLPPSSYPYYRPHQIKYNWVAVRWWCMKYFAAGVRQFGMGSSSSPTFQAFTK